MTRQINIDEVRRFLMSALAQFKNGGINIHRIRVNQNEKGEVDKILIDYESIPVTDKSE